MRHLLIAFALLTLGIGCRAAVASPALGDLPDGPGFAVVELFTSQGCSSCPPADQVLARVAQVAEGKGLPIYPLSLHVDYWNRLGWRDPYSARQFSARQQAYAHVLGTGAYTPQIVVNGTSQTVGSRVGEVAETIAKHVAETPPARAHVEATRDGAKLHVAPRFEQVPDGVVRWIALSRRSVGNPVPDGENAGRDLQHAHVVFALERIPTDNAATFEIPADLEHEPIAVTVFLQDADSLEILAADRVAVSG